MTEALKQTDLSTYHTETTNLHEHLFPDLHQFKQLLDAHKKGLQYQPYTAKKTTTWFYRIVFGVIACLFLGLSYFILSGIPRPFLMADVEHIQWMHRWMASVSFLIALISGMMSFSLKPEKDALRHLFRTAKRKLTRVYTTRGAKVGIKKFFPHSPCYRYALKLKNNYRCTLDRLERQKEELIVLLGHIACTPIISATVKETLYNQALMEFHVNMEATIRSFEGV